MEILIDIFEKETGLSDELIDLNQINFNLIEEYYGTIINNIDDDNDDENNKIIKLTKIDKKKIKKVKTN